ncbi:MAG: DUF21 domain-containing protein [Candidatus Omnitrophica bacterium]|nr:DUF21 domain-containing protein [Candidatus Omnitrophota bacterium]
MKVFTWIGVVISLIHCGLFSGLNLGFFGSSRLRLEVLAEMNDPDAKRVLSLRKDLHFLLATLLWGNVGSVVLLTLFTDSVMNGIGAFFFATIAVTFFGEIIPQAYLAKHALKASGILVPIIHFYQTLLYPFAKPTALFLDKWLGKEETSYFDENEISVLLRHHVQSGNTDVSHFEGMGASNFLALDDILAKDEGEILDPKSIIALSLNIEGVPIFPKYKRNANDKFLQKVHASGEKWIVFTNKNGDPLYVLNADQFLRDALDQECAKSIYTYCHRPIVIKESKMKLGEVLLRLKVRAKSPEDDVIDNDIILYWRQEEKRIITGADFLGRLLRGIVPRK